MATRSAIGVMHGDNCKMVYCHWDGYLQGVGETLLKHYDSPKANHLVVLGNISSLGEEIGEKHPFSRFESNIGDEEYNKLYGNMTTFYGRDREEQDNEYKTFTKFTDAVEYFEGCWGVEFMYIMNNDVWYVSQGDMNELVELSVALEQTEKETV
jgi:hypothetical protein